MTKRVKELESVLAICTGMSVVYMVTSSKYFLFISVGIGISGLFIKLFAKGIHWFWNKLSEILGFISSKIILSCMFFLFLTPIALFYRLFNKNTLNLINNKTTLFKTRNHQFMAKDFDNIW